MNEHIATEIAYKNGYRKGVSDAVEKFAKILIANYEISSVPYIAGEDPTVTCQLTNWDLKNIIKNIVGGGYEM